MKRCVMGWGERKDVQWMCNNVRLKVGGYVLGISQSLKNLLKKSTGLRQRPVDRDFIWLRGSQEHNL